MSDIITFTSRPEQVEARYVRVKAVNGTKRHYKNVPFTSGNLVIDEIIIR